MYLPCAFTVVFHNLEFTFALHVLQHDLYLDTEP